MTQYDILNQYFGYDTFRDGQDVLIKSILEGRDALGIMPTGAGKSLCYQCGLLHSLGKKINVHSFVTGVNKYFFNNTTGSRNFFCHRAIAL